MLDQISCALSPVHWQCLGVNTLALENFSFYASRLSLYTTITCPTGQTATTGKDFLARRGVSVYHSTQSNDKYDARLGALMRKLDYTLINRPAGFLF